MFHNLPTLPTLRTLVHVTLHLLVETGFIFYNLSTLPTLGALVRVFLGPTSCIQNTIWTPQSPPNDGLHMGYPYSYILKGSDRIGNKIK